MKYKIDKILEFDDLFPNEELDINTILIKYSKEKIVRIVNCLGMNFGNAYIPDLLIIKDGSARPIGSKMKNNKNIYRALCEKDGKLCIIESKKVMTYEFFVKCLCDYKVTHALYLDMGRGWNYAWYRDNTGKVVELFPESKMAPSYKYRTNWITFYMK